MDRRYMADLTDVEIDAALARGNIAHATEPRAKKARYDRKRGRIIVELTNGKFLHVMGALGEGLGEGDEDQLAVPPKSSATGPACIGTP